MIASIFFMHFPSRSKVPYFWKAHPRLGTGTLRGSDNALTCALRQSQIIDFDNRKFALAFPKLRRYISPPSTVQQFFQALGFKPLKMWGRNGHSMHLRSF